MEQWLRVFRSPYGRQAGKWLAISFALYVATFIVREVAWSAMLSGTGYAFAFIILLILGVAGTVALGTAVCFAMLAV